MKKRNNIKAKILGLCLLATGIAATAPTVMPGTVMAAETDTKEMYEILRNFHIHFIADDGSEMQKSTISYKGYVSNKSMKFTFQEVKTENLFKDGLGYWKPDKDVIPAVTATYDNPPADVDIYLRKDASKYIEESKTIKRTINYYYVNTNGQKSPAGSYSDSVTFKRPGYIDANGNKVMNEWFGNYTFKEVNVSEKSGYVADTKKVPAKTVTPADSDFEIEVLYMQQKNGFIEENGKVYYYENGNKVKGTRNIRGYNYTFDANGVLISEPYALTIGKGMRPFAIIKDGWYTISPVANQGFALDINGGKADNKANLQIYRSNGTKAQKFYFKSVGTGEYVVYTGTNNAKSALDVEGNKTIVGTNIQQYKANNSMAQVWRVVMNPDNSVTFTAKNSGLALDIYGGKYANKTNVRLYKVNYTKAQNFVLSSTQ